MATPKQVAANRENAKKSTGPTTPEGKAKTKLNSLSHGFASATFFLDGEEQEEFHGLLIDLNRDFQPATHMEQILVEKIAHNQWLSLRAIRLQSHALRYRMREIDSVTPPDLGLLIRYQTAADRAFHKAHAELLKAQEQRKKSENGFAPQNQVVAKNEAEPESASPENPRADAEPTTPEPEIQPQIVRAEKEMAAGVEKLPQAA